MTIGVRRISAVAVLLFSTVAILATTARSETRLPAESWASVDTAAAHRSRVASAEHRALAARPPAEPSSLHAAGPRGETWSHVALLGYNQSSLIVDSANDRLVAYGGYAGGVTTGDVWVKPLSGSAPWTQLDVVGPRPTERGSHVAVYDPLRQRMIVYGGSGLPDATGGAAWALSLSGTHEWTRLDTGTIGPGVRSGARAVYDPRNDRLVLFGGYSWDADSLENEVWVLSLTRTPRWVLLSPSGTPPSRQTETAAIFDPVRQRMVIFGGYDVDGAPYGNVRRTVWALSLGDTLAWTQLHPGSDNIDARFASASAYDSRHDRMLIFGGDLAPFRGPQAQDFWALQFGDSLYWTKLSPTGAAPTGRSSARAVYDSERDQFVMFGGLSSDTWALSLAGTPTWIELEPGGDLSFAPRNLHTAAYDSTRHRVLVFGGQLRYYEYHGGHIYRFNDLWSLTFDPRPEWKLLPSEFAPLGRWGHSMILDPVTDELLVFGGVEHHEEIDYGIQDIIVNNLWRRPLSGAQTWSSITPDDSVPPARCMHSAIYDPVRRRMIVFGGAGDTQRFSDAWALSLDGLRRWTRLDVAGTGPTPRSAHASVYDPVGDRMIVFGGYDGTSALDDTWQLSLGGVPTWSPLPSAVRPPARLEASLTYDSRRQRLVLFAGDVRDPVDNEEHRASDTWILPLADGASWAPAAVTGESPRPREGAAAVYDSHRDQVLILQGQFSEYSGNDSELDTWALTSSVIAPAPLSLVRAQAGPWRVLLQWQGSGDASFVATVERRVGSGAWSAIGTVHPDATGMLLYEDATAQPETQYSYRLTWTAGAAAGSTPAVQVVVPRLRFALIGPSPNPAPDGLTVSFSLPDAAAARLEVMDIAGRQVLSREVGAFGPGDHSVAVAPSGVLTPGIYLVRLSRAGASLVTRACVIR